jgi:hypothetical protein
MMIYKRNKLNRVKRSSNYVEGDLELLQQERAFFSPKNYLGRLVSA